MLKLLILLTLSIPAHSLIKEPQMYRNLIHLETSHRENDFSYTTYLTDRALQYY